MQIISPPSFLSLAIGKLWSHRWFVLAALALLGVGGWATLRTVLGPEVVVEQVKRGNLVKTVVASGHFETPYRHRYRCAGG